jgi:hypothetical protein
MNSKTYFFPVFFDGNYSQKIQIDKNILLRKILKKEQLEFFGIKSIDYDLIKKSPYLGINNIKDADKTQKASLSAKKWIIPFTIWNKDHIFCSNYVFEIKSNLGLNNLIKKLNLCLNLIHPTSSNCSFGFQKNETGCSFPFREYKNVYPYIKISKNNCQKIKKIWLQINSIHDLRFETIMDLFIKSLHDQQSLEIQFLFLSIALESLILPKMKSELRYRFSLRIAKALYLISNEDIESNFKTAQKIYDIRSELAHEGASKKLNITFYNKLLKIFYKLIDHYLNDHSFYQEKNLNMICLS